MGGPDCSFFAYATSRNETTVRPKRKFSDQFEWIINSQRRTRLVLLAHKNVQQIRAALALADISLLEIWWQVGMLTIHNYIYA